MFKAIAAARPKILFIIGDGPRAHISDDFAKVAAARDAVSVVDWPCEVHRQYAESNLGCRARLVSGLSWVFEKADQAIILEDDCRPAISFFSFCEEMLERFRDDKRILLITGSNGAPSNLATESYYFSLYTHIWGWASWKRTWREYDPEMQQIEKALEGARIAGLMEREIKYWQKVFVQVKDGRINTWDVQLLYQAFLKQQLTVTPRKNLVENLGFRFDATHTRTESSRVQGKLEELDFPLIHPHIVERNRDAEAERRIRQNFGASILQRALRKILFRFQRTAPLALRS